jgi:DNA-binding MarR family transcriptional regulator
VSSLDRIEPTAIVVHILAHWVAMSRSNMKASTRPFTETNNRAAFRNNIPYLIGAVANLLSARGARLYRDAFDIGLTEWRVMWVVGHEAPITAATASHIMGTDKGAVSRALAGLDRRGLLRVTSNPTDGRERTIELSPAGWRLHAQISVMAKIRQRALLSIFSAEECAQLKELLARLLDHIPLMDDDAVGRPPTARSGEKARMEKAQGAIRRSSDRSATA